MAPEPPAQPVTIPTPQQQEQITEVPEPQERTQPREPEAQQQEQQQSSVIHFSVRENLPIRKAVGQPLPISLEGIPQNRRNQAYWVMWGAGSMAFSIDRNSGQLKTVEVLDYERQSTYDLVLAKSYVSSPNAQPEMYHTNEMKRIRVTVIDTPEMPQSTMAVPTYPDRPVKTNTRYLSVLEHRPAGTTLTFLGVSNPAQLLTTGRQIYALQGEDAGAFKLVPGPSNRMNIVTAKEFDYETKKRYSFRATAQSTRGTGAGTLFPVTLFIVDIMDSTHDNPIPPLPPRSPAPATTSTA